MKCESEKGEVKVWISTTACLGYRYPGGLYGLYPARLPGEGTALELEAGAVLANDLLRRYRVRYDVERRVQAVTVEEFRSPAQPGTR